MASSALELVTRAVEQSREEKPHASKLLKSAAWAGLCVIAYSTLSPLGDRPILLTTPKLEHVAAFAILGTLFCLAYPRRTLAALNLLRIDGHL
jgi:hypothetical protein